MAENSKPTAAAAARETLGGHIWRTLRFAMPVTCSRVGLLALVIVDTAMSGHQGAVELAYYALSTAFLVPMMMVGVGILLGTVVLTGDTYFSGGSVILDHGWGLYSYFAHLSKILVEEGDLVEPGQAVGHAGATGRVTGPHLHWTLRLNGARVDPLSLIEILKD